MDIEKAIKEKISKNKDERLSTENLVSLALDDFSTMDIVEYYKQKGESDLRYFLERRISETFIVRVAGEKLNTH